MIIYTVKRGDTLWKLSRQYHIELERLLEANPEITDPNYISVGQQLSIPQNEHHQHHEQHDHQSAVNPVCSCSDDPDVRPCIYMAQEGETLCEISRQFMVPLSRLLYHNMKYDRHEQLPAGCRIIIPDSGVIPMPEGGAPLIAQPTVLRSERGRQAGRQGYPDYQQQQHYGTVSRPQGSR